MKNNPLNLTVLPPATGQSIICKPVLQALPAWFGIDDANQHYLDHIEKNLTFIVTFDKQTVGFLSLSQPFPHSAEIYVMGIHPDFHRRGAGKALLNAAENYLKSQGVRFLQVKTLSDKHPSPEYAQTRKFYIGTGFVALEEFPELWGVHNPCLQLIKVLV
ncbi:MAG: GNAT family N-acetyltransferase [Aggregatilineales bacterium]